MTEPTRRVMVITAHPDDPEFGAGGTIAKLVGEGSAVAYVIVTNGEKGSSNREITPAALVQMRETEQRNAALALGVEHLEFLGYEDGEVEDTRQLRLDVTRQIRWWRPELVITQSPHRSYVNFFGWHRDHRVTAGVVLDCVYPLARDHLSFPDLLPQHEPHQVRELYLMEWERPNLLVDVTRTMELKLRAIACHASRIADVQVVEARVRRRASALGSAKGYLYAEGFEHVVVPGWHFAGLVLSCARSPCLRLRRSERRLRRHNPACAKSEEPSTRGSGCAISAPPVLGDSRRGPSGPPSTKFSAVPSP